MSENNGEKLRKTGSDSFEATSKSNKKTAETRMIAAKGGQVFSFDDDMNYVINGSVNGSRIRHYGPGRVTVYGNVENLVLSGSGSIIVYGNVAGGIEMSGRGNIKVFGNVGGRITGSGIGSITVMGTHDGESAVSGFVDLKILTREEFEQQNGRGLEENDEADKLESDVDEEEREETEDD